jgi:folate-binding Fe-S cluster repair protein YgfZ
VDAFTPFEVNLAHEVHLDKGCYTGQETLQRLVTYDSVRRRLAWVRGAGAPPAVPLDLERADARVGRLTTVLADGPGWSGLAVVAWDVADPAGVSAGGTPIDRLEPVPLRRPIGRPWAVAG